MARRTLLTPVASCAIVPALLAAVAGCVAQVAEPVWYPPSEPSPFLPDDALWIGQPPEPNQPWARPIYLRGRWTLRAPVRRAILMTAPSQTVDLYLGGRVTLSGYDPLEGLPVWAEVTDRLSPGEAFLAARVHSEWRPAFYTQMRVEYEDGSWEDLCTGEGWECAVQPAADWPSNPQAGGDWRPAAPLGGYYREPGAGLWGHDFALLPREMLRARFEDHNRRLRNAPYAGEEAPPFRPKGAPDEPRWSDQFRGFCRVDERTGQLIDGAGRVRHLFFTIYGQHVNGQAALGFPEMDLDQFERDLDLMAAADVHLYMRQTGWYWLLTKEGRWAPLERQPKGTGFPRFERGIDLLHHLVQRAYAHGRYIVFEGDFYWGAHSDVVPPPYRSRYHLYPEVLEAQALAMRKIMHDLSECPNVLGMMIGEEDILLAHDLANPHQHALFADYLSRKYGSLEDFRRQTPLGHDYQDLSAFYKQTRTPEYWPGTGTGEVLVPRYNLRQGVFDGAREWLDIPLPLWPGFRSPADPTVTLAGYKSYNEFTPEDPLWIDFYEMREDELLFGMLSRWAEIVRQGMPRQLLFYSNAQDFTNSWHFLHLYRRADLPFDVIGVGCHDSGQDLSELPACATVRKAIKVISSYRPYALAAGSPARGVASGEGEGGRAEHPEEVLNYYRGALFDEIGGGAAWTQTYTWLHVSGSEPSRPPHETPLLKWFSEFMPAAQGVPFPLRRPVEVLIVRNTNLQHSNMSGLDYGNVMTVAETLTQLNVEFDIVMDRNLRGPGKAAAAAGLVAPTIDLSPYRLVIVPSVATDLCDSAWEALDAWLREPARRGTHVLALGRVGSRASRLEPRATFHPTVQQWLGLASYPKTVDLKGKQSLTLQSADGPTSLTVDFGQVPPTGAFPPEDAVLQAADGAAIARRFDCGPGAVVAFGFPLGFAHEPLWGLSPEQSPRDAAVPIFEALLREAGVDRPVLAPHNLRVHVADRGRMILVRERAGLATDAELALRLPEDVKYPGLSLTRGPDGYAHCRIALAPWEGRWWKAEADR